MPRDVDTAALHATFDLVLRTLAAPKAGAASGARAARAAAPPAPAAAPAKAAPAAPPDALIAAYEDAKRSLRDLATRDPFDSVVSVVGVGTLLFYLAEKGKNDKCETIWD